MQPLPVTRAELDPRRHATSETPRRIPGPGSPPSRASGLHSNRSAARSPRRPCAGGRSGPSAVRGRQRRCLVFLCETNTTPGPRLRSPAAAEPAPQGGRVFRRFEDVGRGSIAPTVAQPTDDAAVPGPLRPLRRKSSLGIEFGADAVAARLHRTPEAGRRVLENPRRKGKKAVTPK